MNIVRLIHELIFETYDKNNVKPPYTSFREYQKSLIDSYAMEMNGMMEKYLIKKEYLSAEELDDLSTMYFTLDKFDFKSPNGDKALDNNVINYIRYILLNNGKISVKSEYSRNSIIEIGLEAREKLIGMY